jgi:hypothetical protein
MSNKVMFVEESGCLSWSFYVRLSSLDVLENNLADIINHLISV